MDKNKCNSCGESTHKCSCKNKDFTKAVIQIDNPEQITLMRKVVIPASMGDDTAVPPVIGKYHNVLLNYEANNKSYLYSSDGIPTQLVNGVTDYEAAVNLPQINGNTLIGNKTSEELGLQDKLTAGDNINIENNVISATDTTYGPATDTEIGLVKPGDGLEVASDGTLSISDIEQYAHFFDTVADMKAATNLSDGDHARTLGFYAPDDGGMATYKIRTKTESDTSNEMDLIAIGNSLVAELILNDVANIRQLGAKGDNTTDTSPMLNLAVSTNLPIIIPKGEYKLDSSVVISGDQNIHGEDSRINYTGEDYAFTINTTLKKIVKFGTITAVNGGCLKFYATTTASNDFSQYVDVYFKEFKCKTNGIYAEETGEGSWVNEIRLFNGRLSSYQEDNLYVGTGLKLVHNYNGADKVNGWRCYNLGFEGLNKGVHLISTAGRMNKIMFVGCRYSEAYGTLVTTEGNVSSVLWISTDSIRFDRFSLSNTTSTFKVIAPCSDPDTGQYFGFGAEYNFGTWSCNNHTKLPENADLNDYQIEGVYSCFSNTVRTTLVNVPDEILNTSDDYFTLHVTQTQTSNLNSERRCTQQIISRNGTFSRICYSNNQWTVWRKDINERSTAGSFIQCNTVLQNASADVFGANVLGKFVMFRIDVLKFTQTPPATSTNLLPESVRPKAKYFIPLWNSTTSAYDGRCIIETDGHVKFINCTTSGQYYASMMYFAA